MLEECLRTGVLRVQVRGLGHGRKDVVTFLFCLIRESDQVPRRPGTMGAVLLAG